MLFGDVIMLNKIKNFIKEHHLFEDNQKIICAVSGGVDSVCLLHILYDLGYPLVLAHVNHHKRKESEQEQKQMQLLAQQLQIPFEVLNYQASNTDNFQNEAHFARYDFFKKLAAKYKTKWIATAHHLDDQAETILMRLATGSNLYGYAGISVCLEQDGYSIVRPLLCLSKEELYHYAEEKKYVFYEDSSNLSDDYFRNRLRHHIIPILKKETPSFLEKIQEFSIQAKEAFQFIRNQSIKYLNKQNNIIKTEDFNLMEEALKKDVLCLLFERYQIEKNKDLIDQCCFLISQNKNKSIHLKNNFNFKVEYQKAFIEKKKNQENYKEILTIDKPCIIRNQYKFYFSKKLPQNNAKYLKLCYNDLKLPFFVCNQKAGDFIELSYGSKKVSRIWIDAKIPKEQRRLLPLVFDAENRLLWVYPAVRSKYASTYKDTGDIYLVCEEIKND